MKILVTGGSGNIGGFVVRRLVDAGHAVLNLDLKRPPADQPGEWAYCDLKRRDVLELHLARFSPEAVCHLGEIPNAMFAPEERVYADNAAGTGTLFQAAADAGVTRIAYASSVQVYPYFGLRDEKQRERTPPPASWPIDERTPTSPANGYGAQKVGAEAYLAAMTTRVGWTAAALRLPHCRDFAHTSWLGRMFDRDPAGRLHEFGTWLDARDAADAFEACVAWPDDQPPWHGVEVFTVAAEEAWHRPDEAPIRERLADHLPQAPRLPEDWARQASPLSSAKLRRITGWSPKVGMPQLWEAAGLSA